MENIDGLLAARYTPHNIDDLGGKYDPRPCCWRPSTDSDSLIHPSGPFFAVQPLIVTIQVGSESGENWLAQQRVLQSSQDRLALLAHGGEIPSDATKHRRSSLVAEAARDFLLDFDHANIPFRLVIGLSRQLHRLRL
jgi:hypothetical protein